MKENGFSYKFIYMVLSLLGRLPLGLLYAILGPVRFLAYNIVGYRKKVVRKNLSAAFPEKSVEELRKIEKDFYRLLFDIIAETVKLIKISDAELSRRVTVTNPEVVNQYLSQNIPVVLMLGHLGNWEWIPEISVMMPRGVIMGEVYKRLHDPGWGNLMYQIRNRWKNVEQVEQKKVLRTILGWKSKQTWIVGFIADQRPNNEYNPHLINFFGRRVQAMVGPEVIGKKTGAKFIYLDIEKPKRGHYRLTYKEIESNPQSETSEYPLTERFYEMLQQSITRNPSIWLWSHNRWKNSPPSSV